MWTPGERRGALMVAALLALGTLHDAWRSARPPAPPPPPAVTEAPVARPGPGPPSAAADSAPAAATDLVDLNTAGVRELDALPGIGPVLAARILAERRRRGGFRSPEDLLAVPGIGPRLYERLAPRVRTGARP